MSVDKSKLFTPRLPELDVEVPAVGSVRVRSLSRAEVLSIRGVELDVAEMEKKLLSLAMVDPKLTEEEVGERQAASAAGELEPATRAIMELSGLVEDAAKQAIQRF